MADFQQLYVELQAEYDQFTVSSKDLAEALEEETLAKEETTQAMDKEIDALTLTKAQHAEAHYQANSRLESVRKEMEELDVSIKAAMLKKRTSEQSNTRVKDENRRIQAQLAERVESLDLVQQERTVLQQDLHEMDSFVEELKLQIESVKHAYHDMQAELARLNDQLAALGQDATHDHPPGMGHSLDKMQADMKQKINEREQRRELGVTLRRIIGSLEPPKHPDNPKPLDTGRESGDEEDGSGHIVVTLEGVEQEHNVDSQLMGIALSPEVASKVRQQAKQIWKNASAVRNSKKADDAKAKKNDTSPSSPSSSQGMGALLPRLKTLKDQGGGGGEGGGNLNSPPDAARLRARSLWGTVQTRLHDLATLNNDAYLLMQYVREQKHASLIARNSNSSKGGTARGLSIGTPRSGAKSLAPPSPSSASGPNTAPAVDVVRDDDNEPASGNSKRAAAPNAARLSDERSSGAPTTATTTATTTTNTTTTTITTASLTALRPIQGTKKCLIQ